MCRHFRLYLRTNDQLFTEDFRAVVVDEDGRERSYPVDRHNYFTGHVVGNSDPSGSKDLQGDDDREGFFICVSVSVPGEENSRVQAHIDDNEFSAHILTDEAEYNIEVNMNTSLHRGNVRE